MTVLTRRCVGGLSLYSVFLQGSSGPCSPTPILHTLELAGSHICPNKTKIIVANTLRAKLIDRIKWI
jgi:hypothetical protein